MCCIVGIVDMLPASQHSPMTNIGKSNSRRDVKGDAGCARMKTKDRRYVAVSMRCRGWTIADARYGTAVRGTEMHL